MQGRRWRPLAAQSFRIADLFPVLLAAALRCVPAAEAQTIVHNDEHLSSDRPEAWAMNYVGASTFMTAFGATPALAAWRWSVALDVGDIPGR